MNWICSFLDRYTLISNSDAHSPEKLGREANLFDTDLGYDEITGSVIRGDSTFLGTVEFFPQEGKYHFDGHRRCGQRMNPLETVQNGGLCPVCNKKITIGVLSRVAQLADRDDPGSGPERPPFHSLISLKELLSQIMGVGSQSKAVGKAYHAFISSAGPELDILLHTPVELIRSINRAYSEPLAEGIRRMRRGEVHIEEGYDGEYGTIHVFDRDELKDLDSGAALFPGHDFKPPSRRTRPAVEPAAEPAVRRSSAPCKREFFSFDMQLYKKLRRGMTDEPPSFSDLPLFLTNSTEPDFLAELNEEQRKAVMHGEGPALVLAGPGTGKTRVLTTRAAQLIDRKVNPQNILAVTFTNRAAGEMVRRLPALLRSAEQVCGMKVCTFHSFGLSIISEQTGKTGRDSNFIILDEDGRRDLINEMGAGDTEASDNICLFISETKKALRTASDLDDEVLCGQFARYEQRLRQLNAFDLDDLIYLPALLLQTDSEIREIYRQRYRWILIDEYQDINYAQYRLIKLLMPGPFARLFAIGDPDQAIYGFRGADISFINNFIHDYPGAAVYRLNTSYRCSQPILRASQNILETGQGKRGYLQGLQAGVRVKIVENQTDRSEAEYIARNIERMMGGLRFFSLDSSISGGAETAEISSLSDFAVLCRTREQARLIEEAFQNHSIPYQSMNFSTFHREEPLRSLVDLMKLSMHPENDLILGRLTRRGVLDGDCRNPPLYGGDAAAGTAALHIAGTCLKEELHSKKALFKRFFSLCEERGPDLKSFLEFIDLGSSGDLYSKELEQVAIMTLHAAKGLEFRCVFVAGCEDGLLPYSLFEEHHAHIDEERRLLYVGMTRAKSYLFLSHAARRHLFGREYRLKRSPFLDGIEEELREISKGDHGRRELRTSAQLDLF
jgi:superfamily I DNA/RNA helicase